MSFLEDNHSTYVKARPQLRRQINQALFKSIYVDQTGDVRGELAEPFSTLLSRPVRTPHDLPRPRGRLERLGGLV